MVKVIVALPRKDDPVYSVSSEKIPHMTIMALGDSEISSEDLTNLQTWVKHVVESSFKEYFYMEVLHRQVLGEKQADVLLFDKNTTTAKRLDQFRYNLLQNVWVQKRYLESDQFPVFTPHLTLGYPETPAHPDTREYPGFSYIAFDRIAVWDQEYSGAEFYLDPRSGSLGTDVGHSDSQERIDQYLAHFGVLGMKWGVRRGSSGHDGSRLASNHASSKRLKKGESFVGDDGHTYRVESNSKKIARGQFLTRVSRQLTSAEMKDSTDASRVKDLLAQASTLGLGKLSTADITMINKRISAEKQFKDLLGQEPNRDLKQKIETLELNQKYKKLSKKPDGFAKQLIMSSAQNEAKSLIINGKPGPMVSTVKSLLLKPAGKHVK